MTIKSIVADDKLIKMYRRVRELERRVFEGSLDADFVAIQLQRMIEGSPVKSEKFFPNWDNILSQESVESMEAFLVPYLFGHIDKRELDFEGCLLSRRSNLPTKPFPVTLMHKLSIHAHALNGDEGFVYAEAVELADDWEQVIETFNLPIPVKCIDAEKGSEARVGEKLTLGEGEFVIVCNNHQTSVSPAHYFNLNR